MSKRTYHLVEEKYLAEYISKTFPNAKKVFYQVPVSAKPWQLSREQGRRQSEMVLAFWAEDRCGRRR